MRSERKETQIKLAVMDILCVGSGVCELKFQLALFSSLAQVRVSHSFAFSNFLLFFFASENQKLKFMLLLLFFRLFPKTRK